MIWQFALNVPRIVLIEVLEVDVRVWNEDDTFDPLYIESFVSLSPPPLTCTCAESRALALKYYTRAFQEGTIPRYTYINFDMDTLLMMDQCAYALSPRGVDRHSIKKLLLFCVRYWDDFGFCDILCKGEGSVANMQSLHEFTLMSADWDRKGNDDFESYEMETREVFEKPRGFERPLDWVVPKIKCVGKVNEETVDFDFDYYTELVWREVRYDIEG